MAPGDDFFEYANGLWLKNTEIPPDRSSYGVGAALDELTTKRTADLITGAAKGEAPPGSDARKIGDYYATLPGRGGYRGQGAQAARADAGGASPPSRTRRALATASRHHLARRRRRPERHALDTDNLFGLWVAQDLDDPSHYSPFLLAGRPRHARPRLLPRPVAAHGRDPQEVRGAYRGDLDAAGVADAAAKAPRSSSSRSASRRRTPPHVRPRTSRRATTTGSAPDFAKLAPGLDWDAFFAAARLDKAGRVRRLAAEGGHGHGQLVAREPLATWKD